MRKIVMFVCACLCICALVGGGVAAFVSGGQAEEEERLEVLTLWQIDSFEGGRGSRADYLRRLADEFSDEYSAYIEITSLTSAAARQNIENGVIPDMISYGAGFYGIESIVKSIPRAWCNGAYCLISLSDSDFSQATAENTVINVGKDNLAAVAALLLGLNGAECAVPTSAYVQLIDGEYKFLLGTQRDIQRIKTRGLNFYVQAVEQFNDLYQYIAVLSGEHDKAELAEKFIDHLLSQSGRLTGIAMLHDEQNLYDDEMHALETARFEYGLPAVVSYEAMNKIRSAAQSGDINILKSLLKPL